ARHQAGAHTHVDDSMPGPQTRSLEGPAAVPRPGAERHDSLDPIVVRGRLVEQLAHETLACGSRLLSRGDVVLGERGMRSHPPGVRVGIRHGARMVAGRLCAMNATIRSLLIVAVVPTSLLLGAAPTHADTWPTWRGPSGDGTA